MSNADVLAIPEDEASLRAAEVAAVPLHHDAPADQPAHGPTGWAFVGITLYLGTLATMGPLAIDMYLPSFRKIAGEFAVDEALIQRTLSAYFVGLALGQLVYGPIADRVGRKWPLYFGLVLFVLASAGCALAWNVRSLEALRFVEALGGCAEMVVARAIVRDLFDPKRSAKVFASLMLVMGLAPILAPLLGGWIATYYSWRVVFWTLCVAGTLALASTAVFFKESLPHHGRQKHTLVGTLQTYAGLLAHREFMVYTLASSFALAGLFAYVGGSPYIFLKVFHVPETHFGWFFGLNAFGLISCSQLNGWLVDHFDMRKLLRASTVFNALAALCLLATALTGFGGFVGILVPLFCFMASLGMIFPNTGALAMAPHGRIAGNASAVLGSIQFGISALGGLVVSSIQNGTSVPMAATIAVCAVVGLAINLSLGRLPKTSAHLGAADAGH